MNATGKSDIEMLIRTGIQTIIHVQEELFEDLKYDPHRALEAITIGSRGKPLLTADLLAENNATRYLRHHLQRFEPLVLGEESLRDATVDIGSEERLVILMDMIDGTDLLERDIPQWCSAMVFYYPPEGRIIATFVGVPGECVYYATEGPGVFKFNLQQSQKDLFGQTFGRNRLVREAFAGDQRVTGPSKVTEMRFSTLAFYGQKIKNMLALMDCPVFIDKLRFIREDTTSDKTRLFNLAGNPALVKLVDGHTRFDAVFDVCGQLPHDMVPGAFIARKAGAVVYDLEGNEINLSTLLTRPADPRSRIRYVAAGTDGLARELISCLRPTSLSREKEAA